jgi:hypothetical protein
LIAEGPSYRGYETDPADDEKEEEESFKAAIQHRSKRDQPQILPGLGEEEAETIISILEGKSR